MPENDDETGFCRAVLIWQEQDNIGPLRDYVASNRPLSPENRRDLGNLLQLLDARSRPLPRGRASFQLAAGVSYHRRRGVGAGLPAAPRVATQQSSSRRVPADPGSLLMGACGMCWFLRK